MVLPLYIWVSLLNHGTWICRSNICLMVILPPLDRYPWGMWWKFVDPSVRPTPTHNNSHNDNTHLQTDTVTQAHTHRLTLTNTHALHPLTALTSFFCVYSFGVEHSIKMKDHYDIKSFRRAVKQIPLMNSVTRMGKIFLFKCLCNVFIQWIPWCNIIIFKSCHCWDFNDRICFQWKMSDKRRCQRDKIKRQQDKTSFGKEITLI